MCRLKPNMFYKCLIIFNFLIAVSGLSLYVTYMIKYYHKDIEESDKNDKSDESDKNDKNDKNDISNITGITIVENAIIVQMLFSELMWSIFLLFKFRKVLTEKKVIIFNILQYVSLTICVFHYHNKSYFELTIYLFYLFCISFILFGMQLHDLNFNCYIYESEHEHREYFMKIVLCNSKLFTLSYTFFLLIIAFVLINFDVYTLDIVYSVLYLFVGYLLIYIYLDVSFITSSMVSGSFVSLWFLAVFLANSECSGGINCSNVGKVTWGLFIFNVILCLFKILGFVAYSIAMIPHNIFEVKKSNELRIAFTKKYMLKNRKNKEREKKLGVPVVELKNEESIISELNDDEYVLDEIVEEPLEIS